MKKIGIIALMASIVGLALGGYLLGDGYMKTHRSPDPDEDREQMVIRDQAFGNASKIAAGSVAVAAIAMGALVANMVASFERIEEALGIR